MLEKPNSPRPTAEHRMKWPDFYDFIAAVIGLVGTSLALSYFFKTWMWPTDVWMACSMVISSCLVSRLFRKSIVTAKGYQVLNIAVVVGALNGFLFPAIWLPVVGILVSIPATVTTFPVILPMSIAAIFLLKWADRLDRASLATSRTPALNLSIPKPQVGRFLARVANYRYAICAALVSTAGFLAILFLCFRSTLWPGFVWLTPVATATGMFVADCYRKDIRDEKGWRMIPVSMMIGTANVLLFYGIVAGIGGLVVGLVAGLTALFPALGAALVISPLAYLLMKAADRWDMGGSFARTT